MGIKPSDALRFLAALAAAAVVLGLVVLRVTGGPHAPERAPGQGPVAMAGAPPAPPAMTPPASARPPPSAAAANCGQGPSGAASANAQSLLFLAWAPFRRPETGWQTYAPLIAREIATACAPDSPGFAAALARWQAGHGLPGDGVLTDTVFTHLKNTLELRRPFVRISAQGVCPPAPPESALAPARPDEVYGGKPAALMPPALDAYRRLVQAARAEQPQIGADPRNLTIFSGYRSPDADTARCASEGGCNNMTRATCSAHRTGLALDLYVGQAPGLRPDSSADANRLFMSRTPTYRWLVANADRFGFVPYPFEPWHWEWTGAVPSA
jgi:D-alanyl-D-alanine carboxypeptidase